MNTVSYTHLRAPRDGLLSIRRQRQMCIRDSRRASFIIWNMIFMPWRSWPSNQPTHWSLSPKDNEHCLLYTSPSPTRRTPLYSSAASDVYKRQQTRFVHHLEHDLHALAFLAEQPTDALVVITEGQ